MSVNQILEDLLPIRNPITRRQINSLAGVRRLIRDEIIPVPRGILFNAVNNRLAVDNRRNRRNFTERNLIIDQDRTVRTIGQQLDIQVEPVERRVRGPVFSRREIPGASIRSFRIPLNVRVSEEQRVRFQNRLRGIIRTNTRFFGNQRIRIILGNVDPLDPLRIEDGTVISSVFALPNAAINDIIPKIEDYFQEYEAEDLQVDFIQLEILTPDQGLGQGGVSETQANKRWLILSLPARTNCGYDAVALASRWVKNPELLMNPEKVKNSSKLTKCRINPKIKKYTNNDILKLLSNLPRSPHTIKVFNNIFEHIKTFKPNKESQGTLEIQLTNNHYKALIRWSDIKKYHCQYILKLRVNEVKHDLEIKESKKYCQLIKKFPKESNYNPKIAAWDIEATPDQSKAFKSYMCGLAWHNKTMKYKMFQGLNCLEKFIDFLIKNIEFFDGWTFYAHNGGKFDVPLLLKETIFDRDDIQIETGSLIELNGGIINMNLIKGDYSINFKDSCRMIPGTLDSITKDFKVDHEKKDMEFDKINLDNWDTIKELPEYLEYDCKGLLEVILSFSEGVFKDTGINITDCYTSASLSKKHFYKNYYRPTKYPVYTLTDQIDSFLRPGYFGGRVELSRLGRVKGPLYYYDFTSLFPDVGRQYLPWGKPIRLIAAISSHEWQNTFGFFKVKVKSTEYGMSKKPLHAIMKDGRLIFAHFETPTEIVLFSEEIRRGRELGLYTYELVEGYAFRRAHFLNKYFKEGFQKKAENKAAGNIALSQAYKVIINSGYGFWGLRVKDRDGIIAAKSEDANWLEHLRNDKLINVGVHGAYTFCRVRKDLKVRDFNVSVAFAITSYARMKLYDLMSSIESLGYNIQMCDTDSIITNCNIKDHPELRNKFQPDGTGKQLGSLKNECEDLLKKKFSGIYEQQLKHDCGELYFDELLLGGCKMYSLSKTLVTGQQVSITKSKGYSQSKNDKLTHQDFTDLVDTGKPIRQIQNQFRFSKGAYVSESSPFTVSLFQVPKIFKKQYTKGALKKQVENGPIPTKII